MFNFLHAKDSKILNIISKYFSIGSNTLPATWVVHITRNFLIFYSCYYSTMSKLSSQKSCVLKSNAVNILFEITFLLFEEMWNFSVLDLISIRWNLTSFFLNIFQKIWNYVPFYFYFLLLFLLFINFTIIRLAINPYQILCNY